jgi:hypothetical protein
VVKRFHAIVLIAAITGCGDQAKGVLQGYAEGE